MQLQYNIKMARKLVDSLSAEKGQRVRAICEEIRLAQRRLNHEAEPFFARCIQHCKGICCKNIHINEIVNFLDFVFILTLVPELFLQLHDIANRESLFSADCLFLKNGHGPCLFPPTIKPERCILTFCEDTTPIRREIKTVRSKFTKLSRYTKLKRPHIWIAV